MRIRIPDWVWKAGVLVLCAVVAGIFWGLRKAEAQLVICPGYLASSVFTVGASETANLYVTNIFQPGCPMARNIPVRMRMLDSNGQTIRQQDATVAPGHTATLEVPYSDIEPSPGQNPPRRSVYMQVVLSETFVSSVQMSAEVHNSAQFPSEVVSFSYGKIALTYKPQETSR